MTNEQLEQLSQAELLKLFIEKSHQVQELQARLTIAEAQLSSLGLIQNYIRAAHSSQWEEAIREKLEQLAQTHADLQALLNKADEPDPDTEEPAEDSVEEPQPEEAPAGKEPSEEAPAPEEKAEPAEETDEDKE